VVYKDGSSTIINIINQRTQGASYTKAGPAVIGKEAEVTE